MNVKKNRGLQPILQILAKDAKKEKKCFVQGLESLMLNNFLFSSSFEDILQGKPNHRRQIINLGIIIFLILQLIRISVILTFDVLLEVDLETRNNWGDIYYTIGVAGKLMLSIAFGTTLQSIWFRILCLFKERTNDLNFLRDINDYKVGNKTLLQGEFKTKFVSMAEKRMKKILLRKFLGWKVLAVMVYSFTAIYCIYLEQSFNLKRCVLWVFYSFLTWVHVKQTIIMVFSISGLWHISRYHCQLLVEQLIEQLQRITDKIDSTTPRKLYLDLNEFKTSFIICEEKIGLFNRFSKQFVSNIEMSSSLVLSSSMLVVLRSASQTASYIMLPPTIMMSIEPVAVMASSTSLYSLSRKLYQQLNECFVRIPRTQSLHERLIIKSILKDIGSERNSITLTHGDDSSCDPMDFTNFIASGVSTFIMLINLVDEFLAQIVSK